MSVFEVLLFAKAAKSLLVRVVKVLLWELIAVMGRDLVVEVLSVLVRKASRAWPCGMGS